MKPKSSLWGSAILGGIAGLTLLGSCAENLPGIAPPTDEVYFPVGMALVPEGGPQGSLVVANSNFDQRFNAGSLLALDVDAIANAVGGLAPDAEPMFFDTLSDFARSSVKIRSFGGDLIRTPNPGPEGGSLLFVAVRGRNELLMVRSLQGDNTIQLDCGNQSVEGETIEAELGIDCTLAHILPTNFEDPFALSYAGAGQTGSTQGLLAVGHLRTREESGLIVGDISLVDIEDFQTRIQRERENNELPGALLPNRFTRFGGVSGLVYVPGVIAGQPNGAFISAGRQVGANNLDLSTLSVVRGATADNQIIHQLEVSARAALDLSIAAIEMRSLAVDPAIDRIYASVRFSAIGNAFNAGIAVIEFDRETGGLTVRSVLEVGEELQKPVLIHRNGTRLLYVPDIRADRIWILDVTTDQPVLVSSIFGRTTRTIDNEPVSVALLDSPAQMVFTETSSITNVQLGFVSNFANSTLTVLDVSSADPRDHRVLARMGRNIDADGQSEGP